MPITIKEMLALPTFVSFKLIAGERGLHNFVKKVGIIDHEAQDMIASSFDKNEFVLSTFFNVKETPQEIFAYVQELIKAQVSGLAIKDVFFKELPQYIVDYANKHSFPIFIYSKVYYEDIIMTVINANEDKEHINKLHHTINKIKNSSLSESTLRELAFSINNKFNEYHVAVFCESKSSYSLLHNFALQSLLKYNLTNSIVPYNNGYLAVLTFSKPVTNDYVINLLAELQITTNGYLIGISNFKETLVQLPSSIKECLHAYSYAKHTKQSLIYYENMGVNRVLMPLLGNKSLHKYSQFIISPLLSYDQQNNANLLKTAIVYVNNNGDIKQTAKELYQHSNTVRYRLSKIQQLLKQQANVNDFYLELSLAVSIYLLVK